MTELLPTDHGQRCCRPHSGLTPSQCHSLALASPSGGMEAKYCELVWIRGATQGEENGSPDHFWRDYVINMGISSARKELQFSYATKMLGA